jgi:hypothetical protein
MKVRQQKEAGLKLQLQRDLEGSREMQSELSSHKACIGTQEALLSQEQAFCLQVRRTVCQDDCM